MSEQAPTLTPESFDTLPAPIVSAPRIWHPATRFAFRFAFAYLLTYALCCGNSTLWQVIPFHIGEHLEQWTAWPFFHAAQWLGQHWFHLTGVGAKLHPTGSGDTILNWIAVGVMLAAAILATLIWTLIAESRIRKSLSYPRLFFWFRLIVRLTLGVAMLGYGFAKLFPMQMPPPSLAVLNEPVGNTSPMTMLWTLIGLNPVYEMICGAAEVAAGLLLLFRRTTLLGGLLAAFLTTNIVLYNFCFDVPVKLYAAHLLLLSIALIAPDLHALYRFFILHLPATPIGGWTRPARRYGLRVETLTTVILTAFVVFTITFDMAKGYRAQLASQRHPSPWIGQWHINSAVIPVPGQPAKPTPILTGDGLPATDIFLEPSGNTMIRDSSSVLWRGYASVDDKKLTFTLDTASGESIWDLHQTDPTHFLLTPAPKQPPTTATLTVTRIPLLTHYPLQDRGFHLVNEWGLER